MGLFNRGKLIDRQLSHVNYLGKHDDNQLLSWCMKVEKIADYYDIFWDKAFYATPTNLPSINLPLLIESN